MFFHWKYTGYRYVNATPSSPLPPETYAANEKFTKITRQYDFALFGGSTNDDLIWWTDCRNPISTQLLVSFLSEVSMSKKMTQSS